jgi:hypothetical protein
MGVTLTWIQLDIPLSHPYRFVQGFIIVMSLAAWKTTKMRLQFWIAVAVIAGFMTGQVLFRLIPGLQG